MASMNPPMTRRAGLGGLIALAASGCGAKAQEADMSHVVLLGDSVFDNAAYVGSGPDNIHQLRDTLGKGHRATLLAVDGATMANMPAQFAKVPADATHLVVSVGGNDALAQSAVLSAPARSMADAVGQLGAIAADFRTRYATVLDLLLSRGLPVAVSTIYDPRFPDPLQRRLGATALAVLNDGITREAFRRGVTLLELRLVCSDDGDFANPIEPSVAGGAKITGAIARFVDPSRPGLKTAQVIAGP